MRRTLIAGNWKMNPLPEDADQLMGSLSGLKVQDGREVVIFPPSLYLRQAVAQLRESGFSIGAQNVYAAPKGAYTGEVSAEMVAACGARYCLVGHSERRMYFHEDGEMLSAKVGAALRSGLIPICCIGEPQEERAHKTYEAYLYTQLKAMLQGRSVEEVRQIVVAYEPIWAIGTGDAMKVREVKVMAEFLRNTLEVMFPGVLEDVRILYGGSVSASNAQEILLTPHVDGVLVGGASLKFEEFRRILDCEVNHGEN